MIIEGMNKWINTFGTSHLFCHCNETVQKSKLQGEKRQMATASYVGLEQLEQVYINDVCLPICSWKTILNTLGYHCCLTTYKCPE